ncbi:MAG: hypothetical protein AAF961_13275, partial [Planctomycetota bacterium]
MSVEICNGTDTGATNVVLSAHFSSGLGHAADPNRLLKIETAMPGTIPAGGRWRSSVPLTFDVLSAGKQSIVFRVSSTEVSGGKKELYLIAEPAV